MLMPGTLLGERYEIIEKIGAGGMSIVYKAKDNRLQRYVAIKELREEFVQDEAFVAKFRREALSAASLSHPNIVGIYDVGSDHDIQYIVMEYIEGHTLKEEIEKEGPFDTKTVLNYGIQMVSALRHAHNKKIIHRDIKPQNILITNDHTLKVTDFGIAKAVDSSTIVATGNAIGSVHYFSPEQAKGKFVNETSDLYSCGIVLFEMATKKLPFEADSHISIALKHINEELPKPSLFNPSIPENLEQLILKATSKSQTERYQNADEMLYDMKAILKNPNYVIKRHEALDKTILLTPEETEKIRSYGNYPQHEETEEGHKEASIFEEQQETEAPSIYENAEELNDDDDEEEVSTFYKVLVSVGGVLATLALVVVVSLAAVVWIPSMSKDKNVSVPDLKGMTQEQAEKMLKERSLEMQIVEEFDPSIEKGRIFDQDPEKGASVKKGAVVTVKICVSEDELDAKEEVDVPDVTGKESSEAIKELEAQGLVAKIETRADETVEADKVIDQTPKMGQKLKKGDVVNLIVSTGPEETRKVSVPKIVGSSIQEAQRKLEQNGLKLGAQREENSDIEAGMIIEQGYAEGSEVEEGTSIDVVVSKGPKEVKPSSEPETKPEDNVEKPAQSQEVTQVYSIPRPSDLEVKESYHVKAILTTSNGVTTVFDGQVGYDSFPVNVPLRGTGTGLLDIYVDDSSPRQDTIVFSEEQ